MSIAATTIRGLAIPCRDSSRRSWIAPLENPNLARLATGAAWHAWFAESVRCQRHFRQRTPSVFPTWLRAGIPMRKPRASRKIFFGVKGGGGDKAIGKERRLHRQHLTLPINSTNGCQTSDNPFNVAASARNGTSRLHEQRSCRPV